MIRFLFRALGLLFLAGAFVFFVYDGTKSIAATAVIFTPLTDTWNTIHAASLAQLQPAIERHVGTWLWDILARWVLVAPTFVVSGVIGAILVIIGRRKKPLIGYGR
jgi:hypothetical protein